MTNSLTFKQMTKYAEGLLDVEHRIRAISSIVNGYLHADWGDLEDIFGGVPTFFVGGGRLCFSRFEESCTRSLMYLVGPNGVHPFLKDPECYRIAHNHLWRNFPKCRHSGECELISHNGVATLRELLADDEEFVEVDFRGEE